jgi:hypothetical protein
MAGSSRRSVKRDLLEHMSRALLARVCEPFAAPLRHAWIDVAVLAASEHHDRRHVHALCDALNARPSKLPAELHQILVDIGDVATPAGQEALTSLDARGALPRGTLGPADYAATAWLDHPELFVLARVRVSAATVRTFAEYEAIDDRQLELSPERLAAVEAELAPWLASKNRTGFVRVVTLDGEDRVTFEIQHGRPPADRDIIDPKALSVRAVTDVTAQRTLAVATRATGKLAVHGHPGIREVVRRALGQAFFGSPDHYRAEGTLDLAPLFDPDAALACIPGIAAIELRSVTVRAPGEGGRATYDGEGGDVRASDFADEVRRALARCIVLKARIDVKLEGRDAFAQVDLGPGASLHFDRDDRELDRAVRALLVARRIMRPGRATARKVG